MHIGTRRSPLHTPEQAADFARAITRRPGFRLVGVMGYEGQIAGLGDAPPGHPVRAWMIRLIQGRSMPELVRRRTEAIRQIQAVTSLEFVNGGGTGSLESTARDTSVTELTAGSGLVGPTLFDAYRRFSPEPALLFALPVVRRPGPAWPRCSPAATSPPAPVPRTGCPAPYLPAGLGLTGAEGAGEVQTPVRGPAADQLRPGTGSGCATPRPASWPSASANTTYCTRTASSAPCPRTGARASVSAELRFAGIEPNGRINRLWSLSVQPWRRRRRPYWCHGSPRAKPIKLKMSASATGGAEPTATTALTRGASGRSFWSNSAQDT